MIRRLLMAGLLLAAPAGAADIVTAFRCGSEAEAREAAQVVARSPVKWKRELNSLDYCSFGPSFQDTRAEQSAAAVPLEDRITGPAIAAYPSLGGGYTVSVYRATDDHPDHRPVFVLKIEVPNGR